MRYLDKWGNERNPNPFKKIKHRKNCPNWKTWMRFYKNKTTKNV